MGVHEAEFTVLRQTIATRGTVRMLLLPITLIAWASLTVTLLLLTVIPFASMVTLAVVVGGFEAIHAMHVGVERIGRYLQVFYEAGSDGPRWETTAMAVGPSLPGGGIDPLFSAVFVGITVLNVIPALIPQPTSLELWAVGLVHGGFIFRVIRARGAAARQRAVELETYLRLRESNR